jgi:hypothetical protein
MAAKGAGQERELSPSSQVRPDARHLLDPLRNPFLVFDQRRRVVNRKAEFRTVHGAKPSQKDEISSKHRAHLLDWIGTFVASSAPAMQFRPHGAGLGK